MNEVVQSVRDQNWAAMIREQKASGLTIRQWCADNNISENCYYYRLRRIREQLIQAAQPTPEDKNGMTRLVRVPDSAVSADNGSSAIIIRKGTLVIEINHEVSEGILNLMKEVLLNAE